MHRRFSLGSSVISTPCESTKLNEGSASLLLMTLPLIAETCWRVKEVCIWLARKCCCGVNLCATDSLWWWFGGAHCDSKLSKQLLINYSLPNCVLCEKKQVLTLILLPNMRWPAISCATKLLKRFFMFIKDGIAHVRIEDAPATSKLVGGNILSYISCLTVLRFY